MESDKQQKRERSGFTNQKLLNKLKRMKKLFYYCLLLLPTLLIWQCKDDDYPPLPPVDTSLKFHVEDTLVMSTAGGSSTISLQSAKDWKLDVEYDATDPDKDWLSTDPTSGTASGTASVTVTTLASLVERKATLVLSQVGEDTEAPVRLVVRQDVDGFSVEKKNYPVGYEESVVQVKFLTNVTNYAAEGGREGSEVDHSAAGYDGCDRSRSLVHDQEEYGSRRPYGYDYHLRCRRQSFQRECDGDPGGRSGYGLGSLRGQ